MTPEITVLMSVYNGERYLKEAVESILNQTYKDFEFLIINDGSTDLSKNIILSYNDLRIRLIDNENNIGLTRSLNKGLKLARGKYIARMDADDVSMPERFEAQINFMENHPDVGLLGSWVEVINEEDKIIDIWELPETHVHIRWCLLFGNCLAHSVTFFRRAIAIKLGGYNERFKRAQDYDLWSRMCLETTINQLPKILIKRRANKSSRHEKYVQEQEETVLHVMADSIYKTLGKDVDSDTIHNTCKALQGNKTKDVDLPCSLIIDLFNAYKSKFIHSEYDRKLIQNDMINRIAGIYKINNNTTYSIWNFLSSNINSKTICLKIIVKTHIMQVPSTKYLRLKIIIIYNQLKM